MGPVSQISNTATATVTEQRSGPPERVYTAHIRDPHRGHVTPNRVRNAAETMRLAGHAVQVTVIRLRSRLIGPS
jgi:hypothetical protein